MDTKQVLERISNLEKQVSELTSSLRETELQRDRLRASLNIPVVPRHLGHRLKGLKLLWAGPCHIEAFAEYAHFVECTADHLLFQSREHEEVQFFEAADYDAIVVGVNLTSMLAASSDANTPYLPHLQGFWTQQHVAESLDRCESIMKGFLDQFASHAKGVPVFVVPMIEPSFDYVGMLNDSFESTHLQVFVRSLNERLLNLVRSRANQYWCDINAMCNSIGRFHLQDDIHMYSARASFIVDYDPGYDIEAGRIVPPLKPTSIWDIENRWRMINEVIWDRILDDLKIIRQVDAVKLIIVDLDDTLWRGVAAEGDRDVYYRTIAWPMGFVEALLYFKRRGGMLAICSKNDEAETRMRFAQIWRNIIRIEDFVSVKINWEPKSENIAKILAEANILADNAVFIDDNPREVDEVKARFPTIRTIGFQHYDWRRIILQSPETQVARLTEESRDRTQLVKARIAREEASQGVDRAEWLRSLELRQTLVKVNSTAHPSFARVFELVNKTNQFNTTGKRWSHEEFEQLFSIGGYCLATSLRDKTADNGLIGIIIVQGCELVQAVLSCRVFALGAEVAMGAIAVDLIGKSERLPAMGTIVKTDKNLASRDFFLKLGFHAVDGSDGRFQAGKKPSVPDWIAVDLSAL